MPKKYTGLLELLIVRKPKQERHIVQKENKDAYNCLCHKTTGQSLEVICLLVILTIIISFRFLSLRLQLSIPPIYNIFILFLNFNMNISLKSDKYAFTIRRGIVYLLSP